MKKYIKNYFFIQSLIISFTLLSFEGGHTNREDLDPTTDNDHTTTDNKRNKTSENPPINTSEKKPVQLQPIQPDHTARTGDKNSPTEITLTGPSPDPTTSDKPEEKKHKVPPSKKRISAQSDLSKDFGSNIGSNANKENTFTKIPGSTEKEITQEYDKMKQDIKSKYDAKENAIRSSFNISSQSVLQEREYNKEMKTLKDKFTKDLSKLDSNLQSSLDELGKDDESKKEPTSPEKSLTENPSDAPDQKIKDFVTQFSNTVIPDSSEYGLTETQKESLQDVASTLKTQLENGMSLDDIVKSNKDQFVKDLNLTSDQIDLLNQYSVDKSTTNKSFYDTLIQFLKKLFSSKNNNEQTDQG